MRRNRNEKKWDRAERSDYAQRAPRPLRDYLRSKRRDETFGYDYYTINKKRNGDNKQSHLAQKNKINLRKWNKPKTFGNYDLIREFQSAQTIQLGDLPQQKQKEVRKELLTCVKRKIRSRVLHALKIAGKSGLGGPNYRQTSKVVC